MNKNQVADLARKRWDVIVVGTGMGGSTLGYRLAKSGRSVLFCDKGVNRLAADESFRGQFAEMQFTRPAVPSSAHHDQLRRAGRWTDYIEDISQKRIRRYIPFIGSGSGGSSSLYGMALERLYVDDFTPRRNFVDSDADIVESWPITYEELRPYYRQAEQMFAVRGSLDPLRSEYLDALAEPSPMSGTSTELFEFLRGKGMNPYRLPLASECLPDCIGCQGFLCPSSCKKDASNTCLQPAVEHHGAAVIDCCRVRSLTANEDTITGVDCVVEGEQYRLIGETVVLAAGALETPCILLRSRSSQWPDGIANQSGLVGRNLMRHYVDLYALQLKSPDGLGSGKKQIATNDFYRVDGFVGGTVQSFGALPPASVIAAGMQQDLRDHGYGWATPGLALATPLLRVILDRKLSRSVILASIMEDVPRRDNCVTPHENGMDVVLRYTISASEKERIREMRKRVGQALRPNRFMAIKQAENNERIAHACGTCRFGNDPSTSVLDKDNRAHGIRNLYVADSSFFPSSGGINPALTIAANALRVGDRLLGETSIDAAAGTAV